MSTPADQLAVLAEIETAHAAQGQRIAALAALMAPAVVIDPPAPPPVAPPAPSAETIEAFANDHYQSLFVAPAPADLVGKRISAGPHDTLRIGAVAAPKPWDVFTDEATFTFARPAGGKRVAAWDLWNVWGTRNFSGHCTPAVIDGQFRQLYPSGPGNSGPVARADMDSGKQAWRSGPRGVGIATPYTTWHCHVDWAQDADGKVLTGVRSTNPHVPFAIGIAADGQMCRLAKDGGVYYDAMMPRLPQSYFFDFCYYDPDRSIHFVADTGAGRILRVKHTPKLPQTFTAEIYIEGLQQPTSLRAIEKTLYIVESTSGKVWAVNTETAERRVLCTIPWAWWIDYDSQGRLVVLDRLMHIHRVDADTGAILFTREGIAGNTALKEWVQCSVDRTGSCGEVDATLICCTVGAGNVDVYYDTADGVRVPLHHYVGHVQVGPAHICNEISHYPWVVAFHPTQACILLHGFAEQSPTLLVGDAGLKWASHDLEREKRAVQAWLDGGAPALRGLVPSFSCQTGGGLRAHGWSFGGLLTFDALAEMEPQAAADFLRAGGIGSVPRPIPTDLVREMLWWARYNSHEHVRQAQAGTAEQWMSRAFECV